MNTSNDTMPPTRKCVRCSGPVGKSSYYIGADGPFCEDCSKGITPRGGGKATFVRWLLSLVGK